ncbi:MAG: methyltransferase domain-containing protein [Clostridia bacterium]|nr:MAG: methyltransferase domain-containing protein [Clostridia bacterium]
MQSAGAASCCGPATCCGTPNSGTFGKAAYSAGQEDMPTDALQASLGCGNPTALADLAPGKVVLDLGCGGGLDVILAARRVGPEAKVYGLDVSDIVLLGTLPPELKRNLELWAGCIAGALERGEYLDLLQQVGFSGAEVVITHTYSRENLLQREMLALTPGEVAAPDGKIASAFVRAVKPQI